LSSFNLFKIHLIPRSAAHLRILLPAIDSIDVSILWVP